MVYIYVIAYLCSIKVINHNQILIKMTTTNQTAELKKIFTSHFATLNPLLWDLNEATLKVMASYEDGEGGFYEPELILDGFNETSDEDALNTMLEDIHEEWLEVSYKKEGYDYIITAGSPEAVYAIRLHVFRIK